MLELALPCSGGRGVFVDPSVASPEAALTRTVGGDSAAMIVGDTAMHLHISCVRRRVRWCR
jgi:hypothetical protein